MIVSIFDKLIFLYKGEKKPVGFVYLAFIAFAFIASGFGWVNFKVLGLSSIAVFVIPLVTFILSEIIVHFNLTHRQALNEAKSKPREDK